MLIRALSIAVALAIACGAAAQNRLGVDPLRLGDPAPQIGEGTVSWIKGEPVTEWKDGHVYVLDFWATWCTPCIQAMPHMAEVARKHAKDNVHVLAIAIWPSPGMVPTRDFVAKKGDDMPFTVGDAIGETMVNRFMFPTGQTGIPTTMIIGRDGTLLFVGHPMLPAFDAALKAIIAGEYTGDDAREYAARQERAQILLQQANALANRGDWDGAIVAIDEIIAIDPDAFADLAVIKFQRMLITLGRYDESYAFGAEIVKTILSDKPYLLELMARTIMDAPGLARRDYALARASIDRCIELIGESDEGALATYASVLLAQGETDKARKTIDAALNLATTKQSDLLLEITQRRERMLAEIEAAADQPAGG